MIRLFSLKNKEYLIPVEKTELELNKILCQNWSQFFPHLLFIKSEFPLNGPTRSSGTSGRIDILAFNTSSNCFVILELKRQFDKNIRNQISDYKDYIEENFLEIYTSVKEDYDIPLPKRNAISKTGTELILIAKQFGDLDVSKAIKYKNELTLIRYTWFEDDLFSIQYLNNPSPLLQVNMTKPTTVKTFSKDTINNNNFSNKTLVLKSKKRRWKPMQKYNQRVNTKY